MPRRGREKKAKQKVAPIQASKKPRQSSGTSGETLSWGVSMLDRHGPFGHAISADDVAEILDFLKQIEKQTWNEVLKNRRDGGNHEVEVRLIQKAAQKRLKDRDLDDIDTLISLRMGAKKRIWGVRQGAVFRLLWWDPKHQVFPTEPRHT